MPNPSKWSEREELLVPKFDRALALRVEGDYAGALRLLMEVVAELPQIESLLLGQAQMQLGHIYRRKLGDAASAEPHFRAAVAAMPQSELASLNLFHVLVALGRVKESLKEMIRLVSLRDSDGYRELLSDGLGMGLPSAERQLVNHARMLLERYHDKQSSDH